jgi:hypothetical protein
MTTSQQPNDSFDSMAQTALRVKAERDALLAACKRAYAELDDCYDVTQDSEGGHKEYPFTGAGELMIALRRAIDKATA